MKKKPRKRSISRFERLVTICIKVAFVLFVIVFAIPYFESWIVLRYFLLCAMGLTILWYLYQSRVNSA